MMGTITPYMKISVNTAMQTVVTTSNLDDLSSRKTGRRFWDKVEAPCAASMAIAAEEGWRRRGWQAHGLKGLIFARLGIKSRHPWTKAFKGHSRTNSRFSSC